MESQLPPTPDYIQTGYAISPYGEKSEIVIVGNNARWAQGEAPFYAAYQISGMPAYAFWAGVFERSDQLSGRLPIGRVRRKRILFPQLQGLIPVAANQATWFADLGATTSVAVSLAGQHTVAGGIYTFNAALQGTDILLNYQYGGVPYDLDDAVVAYRGGDVPQKRLDDPGFTNPTRHRNDGLFGGLKSQLSAKARLTTTL